MKKLLFVINPPILCNLFVLFVNIVCVQKKRPLDQAISGKFYNKKPISFLDTGTPKHFVDGDAARTPFIWNPLVIFLYHFSLNTLIL